MSYEIEASRGGAEWEWLRLDPKSFWGSSFHHHPPIITGFDSTHQAYGSCAKLRCIAYETSFSALYGNQTS